MAAFQAAHVSSILTICSICRITQEADEGDLLSRYTRNSIEGSNPSFDAIESRLIFRTYFNQAGMHDEME